MPKLKIHPDLLQYYGKEGPPPKTLLQDQIRLLAMRGAVARAGGARSGANDKTHYAIDPINPAQAANYLAAAFEYGTPADGSIF